MAKRRGFWAELQQERARRERDAERANREALQEARRAQREEERRLREVERREAADERERKKVHVAQMKANAEAATQDLNDRIDELGGVLAAGVHRRAGVSFEALKRKVNVPPFDAQGLDMPEPAPVWGDFTPDPPSWLTRKLGMTANYERDLVDARQAFEDEVAAHAVREKQRGQKLDERRRAHGAKAKAIRKKAKEHNAKIDEFEAAVRRGDPEAVERYFEMVLDASPYPEGFPHRSELRYMPERQELVVEWELPPLEVIPDEAERRYVQTRDEIVAKARPDKEVKQRYANLVAQVTLRVLHEVFSTDVAGQVDTVTFGGKLSSIDRATGKPIRPLLVNVTATREAFSELVLTDLDPAACLTHLNALISPHPYDLEAVRPAVDFDALLAMHKLVEGADVLAGLDSRPDLLALSPLEFEHFTRQLFEAMGMRSWETQHRKDDGVDAVAINEDPVFRGLCIIQAKRYSRAVGVGYVRELIGAMDDKRATKGVLVTTSWVTAEGRTLAARNGRCEIIDGENLKYLCKEHLDLDILISLPKPPPKR